jgi:hypothetical protein
VIVRLETRDATWFTTRIPLHYQEFLIMKRFVILCLAAGLVMPWTFGCENKAKTEKKETVTGPGGSTTTTDTHKVESSGQNPPPNERGETAK